MNNDYFRSLSRTIWILLFGLVFGTNTIRSQNGTISVDFKDSSPQNIIDNLKSKTSYQFIYQKDLDLSSPLITLKKENATIDEILNDLQKLTGLIFRRKENNIAVKRSGSASVAKTEIEGVVVDTGTKSPLYGVTITIKELKKVTVSDLDGKFNFTNVNAGSYTLLVNYLGYKNKQITVTLTDDQIENTTIVLEEEVNNLSEVVVKAKRAMAKENEVLRERRKSLSVSDGISNELITKTASVVATQAMQKVSGVSVKDGNINIRGMGERNIVVEMNGARLSGSNANRPGAVSLDLIPSGMLENITVEKSVLPNLPGDATAGLVKLTTRSMPDSLTVQVTAMAGFMDNIGINGHIISFKDASIGAFGHNNKHEIPQGFMELQDKYPNQIVNVGGVQKNYTTNAQLSEILQNANSSPEAFAKAQEVNKIMEGFTPAIATSVRKAPLNQAYGLFAANKFSLFGRPLGVGVGLNYLRRSQQVVNGINNRYYSDLDLQTNNQIRLTPLFNYEEFSGSDVLNYGGLANITYQFDKGHEITAEYSRNQGNESKAIYLRGTPFNLFTSKTQDLGDPLVAGSAAYVVGQPIFNRDIFGYEPAPPYSITNQAKVYQHQMQITKKELTNFQIRGKHSIKDLLAEPITINWTISKLSSQDDIPDFRNSILTEDSNVTFAGRPETLYSFSTYRFFRNQKDKNKNAGLDITVPFKIAKKDTKFSTGFNYLERKRDYTEAAIPLLNLFNAPGGAKLFDFNSGKSISKFLSDPAGVPLGSDLNALTNPNYMGIWETAPKSTYYQSQAGYIYDPTFKSRNNYNALSKITAIYGMFDINLSSKLRIAGGLRVEDTDVRGERIEKDPNVVLDKNSFNYYENYVADQQQIDFLPSGTIIYNPISKMNIRLSGSKTIARPDLFELVPGLQILDLEQQAFLKSTRKAYDEVSGENRLVRLKNAEYINTDIRWEYFLRPSEVLSASLFGKRATNQLEVVYDVASPEVQNSLNLVDPRLIRIGERVTRNNPNVGYLYGFELEARLDLSRISMLFENFLFGFNGIVTKSYSDIAESERQATAIFDQRAPNRRPLFEQPNFVCNLNLGYDNQKGTAVNLYFNQVGERLVEVISDGSPNLYERPAPVLDFNFTTPITIVKGLQFKFFAKNLLNQNTEVFYKNPGGTKTTFGIADETYLRRRTATGREFMAGFMYKF